MHTVGGLMDVHERTHRSLAGLLEHCAGFSEDELRRPLDGFGYACIFEQLHHMVGAERYWVGVLRGEMLTDEDEADQASLDAVRAFRDRVVADTIAWFGSVDDEAVNAPRMMTTWGGNDVELVPAHVILRTQTHVYQHQGQVTAMARLLGRPVPPGLDFPMR